MHLSPRYLAVQNYSPGRQGLELDGREPTLYICNSNNSIVWYILIKSKKHFQIQLKILKKPILFFTCIIVKLVIFLKKLDIIFFILIYIECRN